MCRDAQADDYRQARFGSRQHELRRAAEPDHADEHAAVHPTHQCVQQEAGKPRAQVALYALWYNFVRIHKSLRASPAMAAGIEKRLWSMEGVVALIDARSAKITGETLIG